MTRLLPDADPIEGAVFLGQDLGIVAIAARLSAADPAVLRQMIDLTVAADRSLTQ